MRPSCIRRTQSEASPLPRFAKTGCIRKSTALHLHVESVPAERITSPFRPLQIEPPCSVPTGIPALDEPRGGLPRDCLTDIFGPPSSGKTSFLQSALTTRTADKRLSGHCETPSQNG